MVVERPGSVQDVADSPSLVSWSGEAMHKFIGPEGYLSWVWWDMHVKIEVLMRNLRRQKIFVNLFGFKHVQTLPKNKSA